MLSVGASTALISLINALVLRQLPIESPGELAVISLIDPKPASCAFST
jgi:hypothetical protein